jgi:hypothetical protein
MNTKPLNTIFHALLLTAIFLAVPSPQVLAGESLMERRPCGPDSLRGPLRYLIPQQFRKADFRPSCYEHDRCYEIPGVSKQDCDLRYYKQMCAACRSSKNPNRCLKKAERWYRIIQNNGDRAFQVSQKKANEKSNRKD